MLKKYIEDRDVRSRLGGAQLDRLKEMVIDGRRDMEAVGATSTPSFNYPIDWTWTV